MGKSNSESAETALIPKLGPISASDLKLNSSTIYEGLDGKPNLSPAWDAVVPSQDVELLNYRIPAERLLFRPEWSESARASSTLKIVEPAAPAEPEGPKSPEPFAKYIRQEKKEASA
jgi:hypothetical protein